jgi:hypothetical protein
VRVAALATTALLLVAPGALADPVQPGTTFAKRELPDQHGEVRAIDESVRFVVFSRDMKAGDVVKATVEKAGPDVFDRSGAVYVVDLQGMPALVRRLFAMPGLRRRPYRLLVDTDGSKTADIPGGAGAPTVLVLDRLRVVQIALPTSAQELSDLLAGAAAVDAQPPAAAP